MQFLTRLGLSFTLQFQKSKWSLNSLKAPQSRGFYLFYIYPVFKPRLKT